MSSLFEKVTSFKQQATFDDVIEDELTKAISDLYHLMAILESQNKIVEQTMAKCARDTVYRVRTALTKRVWEEKDVEKAKP